MAEFEAGMLVGDSGGGKILTGKYDISTPYIIGRGMQFRGLGPVGNDKRGPILLCHGSTDGLVLDGAYGAPYENTGSTIHGLKVIAASGSVCGTAILLTARDRQSAPGEVTITRTRIFDQGAIGSDPAGVWMRGLVVDGRNLTVPGQAGIRRTVVCDFRTGGIEEAIQFWNAVNLSISNAQVDPGPSGAVSFVRITGGQNITGSDLIINGDVIITDAIDVVLSGIFNGRVVVGAGCRGVSISGRVRKLVIEEGATGSFDGMADSTMASGWPWHSKPFRVN